MALSTVNRQCLSALKSCGLMAEGTMLFLMAALAIFFKFFDAASLVKPEAPTGMACHSESVGVGE